MKAMAAKQVMQRLRALGFRPRSVWDGDDGCQRCGHSGDVVTMLEDMGMLTVAAKSVVDTAAQ